MGALPRPQQVDDDPTSCAAPVACCLIGTGCSHFKEVGDLIEVNAAPPHSLSQPANRCGIT